VTADAATLRALIARLEAGETGEPIDIDIQKAFTPAFVDVERSPVTGEVFALLVEAPDSPCADGLVLRTLWRVTRSVDTAIAFTEAVLPGRAIELRLSGFGGRQAILWNPTEQPAPGYDLRVDLAVALALATLKAKLAEREE